MRTLALALFAFVPSLAFADLTYEPEGVFAEQTLDDGRTCFRIEAGKSLALRVAGGGSLGFDVRIDLNAEVKRTRKHEVKIVADGEVIALVVDSKDGGQAAKEIPFADDLHEVAIEMPPSAKLGGCVALSGATRGGKARPPEALATVAAAESVPPPPPAEVTRTIEPEILATPSEKTGRLVVGALALGGARDEKETRATRFGGFGLQAGWHFTPDLAAVASTRHAFSNQPYLLPGAPGQPSFDERTTDAQAVVEWRVKHDLWNMLAGFVFAGPRAIFVRSDVYRPWMGGLLVGARLEALLHEGLVADAHGGWAHALLGAKDDASTLGSFKTTYAWGGGLALRFAPHFRFRLGYRGDVWVLDHTNRVAHGAEVGLIVRML